MTKTGEREMGREPTSEEHVSNQEYSINASERTGVADIAEALEVEQIDADLYKSIALWKPARARGVFGGQVIAQAVAAANKTVRQGIFLHSLHSYFLLAGDETRPIIYQVARVRDGGSYVTRSVKAIQKGKTIFTIILSYQKPEPDQPTFAIPVPSLDADGRFFLESITGAHSTGVHSAKPNFRSSPAPQHCPLNEERYQKVLQHGNPHPRVRKVLEGWISDRQASPVEIRDALPGMYDKNGFPTPGNQQAFWMRTKLPMSGGLEAQKVALAYASDFYLLSTVPKALNNSRNIKMMASLDHSMWFYQPFQVHDWLLFVMQTQAASNGRGVVIGRIYRMDGTLVAVVCQEGLIRGQESKPQADKAKDSKL
ncbi:probable peroxisomal acyl-coenzyme A thioester hydrolase 1 [Melanopsichium pennsylvanicum]|uniref:Probable peroxisomal acyl-coenzyme A thioester hydrolase 1 n=2 Tax=Melanopsichium pennsylvanicum TaxID=63383 RepID=A0AAJ4XGI2_9BASI|nr:probable peroxisomal acyl-coenzyme A thioester hydrolase 1 [Melanopsichium pennsylvanicum 4]SNX81651.1 probable peroxisomal acyl-coenzyme A thioester hydrolase 1 [Melanopsichium pennsylvanicum]